MSMTITEQLVKDLVKELRSNPPEGFPKIEVHAKVEAMKRPVPCIVIHVNEDSERVEPLPTTYMVDGHIDLLTSLDKIPPDTAKELAGDLFAFLNARSGLAIGKSFLHDLEARPSEGVADERNYLQRVPFEAVVQPCE